MMTCVNRQFHQIHKKRRNVISQGRIVSYGQHYVNAGCVYYEFSNFQFKAVCGVEKPDYEY